VSHKSQLIAERVASLAGGTLDARYLGYFDCFNRQLFYEAHEVLEDLWLGDRSGPDGAFYKGLIQLAGAFVHVGKQRPQPAAALLKLARGNLAPCAPVRHDLEIEPCLGLIAHWLARLEAGAEAWCLTDTTAPWLVLRAAGAGVTGPSGDREKSRGVETSPTGVPPAP